MHFVDIEHFCFIFIILMKHVAFLDLSRSPPNEKNIAVLYLSVFKALVIIVSL